MNFNNDIRKTLAGKGLKITMQRLIIFEVLLQFKKHPSAERVIQEVKSHHPNISPGTIYKTLELFVNNGLIHKVKTEKGRMRYDPDVNHHHHIYLTDSDQIMDYRDKELDQLLSDYFSKNRIPELNIDSIILQINGRQVNE